MLLQAFFPPDLFWSCYYQTETSDQNLSYFFPQLSDGIKIVDIQKSQNQVFLELQSKGLKGGGMENICLCLKLEAQSIF